METYKVKELMVPISEYATVNRGATLYEAILALEKAQEEYDHSKYRHRAVLVLDQTGKVIGKCSPMTRVITDYNHSTTLGSVENLFAPWSTRGAKKTSH